MSVPFLKLPGGERWQRLVNCGRRALEENGYEIERAPGMGRQNVWDAKKDGVEKRVCIRTTQDRWIAFPPLAKNKWKTLDDVEEVVVVAVDDTDFPTNADVYIFPADDVRQRFEDAYKARVEAGRKVTLDFGMWVALDLRDLGDAIDVGSGIVENYSPISVFPLESAFSEPYGEAIETESDDEGYDADKPQNVQQALLSARQMIAKVTGMPIDQVHLELRIGG